MKIRPFNLQARAIQASEPDPRHSEVAKRIDICAYGGLTGESHFTARAYEDIWRLSLEVLGLA